MTIDKGIICITSSCPRIRPRGMVTFEQKSIDICVHDSDSVVRQRCMLRHVISLYNVQPTFHHLCYNSHIIGELIVILRATTEIELFEKPKRSPAILCSTPESNPRPLAERGSQIQ
ncbi:hypothetical protein SFRURICE_002777 [Spodoptera frugiperda]|nr:hypothetical protein SFRURICE_002777 [Spodoptera frugiperda]